MAITTAMCTSFKVEILRAVHDLTASTGDVIKGALIKASMAGTYGEATTNYSDVTGNSDEASGTGYSAGGPTLDSVTPTSSGTTAIGDFADETISGATITARGLLIYNSSESNKSISVHDFGSDKTSSGGDFVIQFPTPDASNAVLRIA